MDSLYELKTYIEDLFGTENATHWLFIFAFAFLIQIAVSYFFSNRAPLERAESAKEKSSGETESASLSGESSEDLSVDDSESADSTKKSSEDLKGEEEKSEKTVQKENQKAENRVRARRTRRAD
ncbi:hypothetical protein MHBO_000140 [Bonamia ostreae]|uniref:Uncharacterized protein n=1 Tax=Bonamia ostreae TaxID=126728 RepID=A0ABV2AEI9_9EUKA